MRPCEDLPVEFPPGFFDRMDPSPDDTFYVPPRLVTHIDDRAVAAVGALYDELGVDGDVVDLMGSWVSHFTNAPRSLTVLGMNAHELRQNPQAAHTVVHDLNRDPTLPFDDAAFDHAVCCVSVDYLVEPIAVFREVARVLRPGGQFVCTFSNRCFPTKVVRGWLEASDAQRCEIVSEYFRHATTEAVTWEPATVRTCVRGGTSDPLYAVWSRSVHSST
jgi:SAM-dependent methyltransferase